MTRKILTTAVAPAVLAAALAAALAASAFSAARPAAAASVAGSANTDASTAAVTASFTFAWPALREGSRGEAVVALQYLLTARGFSTAGVDGIFGPRTRAAVMRFQAFKKLSVDGMVGNQTWPAVLVTISRGNTGDSVRALQSELTANGIRVTVDGIFGPQTLTAVHQFEARYRLAGALGVVGPATWNALISHGK
jgi:peptidoglycan hydrolase-like protein with peptidoglycan-binding domain